MTDTQIMNNPTLIDETSTKMGSVVGDLRAAATLKIDETVAAVQTQANDAKAKVASDVKDVSFALRRASEELRSGSAQERTLGQIAKGLADASDALRDKDLGEILQSVNKVARDNPGLFLGGAVLLGFAASRFAKASSSQSPSLAVRTSSGHNAHTGSFVHDGNPNAESVGP
ncbi:MAG: hypothetical protein ABIO62_13210 [Paracoccaceae bacterium]